MTLPRNEARAATAALLKDATTAGVRVYPTRIVPSATPVYPFILVYADEESMTGDGISVPQFAHDLTIVVDARMEVGATDSGDGEDALDSLCESILTRLLTNSEWVRRFDKISGIRIHIGTADQGETQVISALIRIGVSFGTIWEPVVPDALASVRLAVDAIDPSDPNLASPGPDGRPEAGGTFTVPTT